MTTDQKQIERAFAESLNQQVELTSQGLDRFLVHVPLTFEDGDHYVVVLKREGDGFVLTDEGHTLMHISYEVPEYGHGNRRAIIDRVLATSGIEDREGELVLPIRAERYGDSLYTYLQALTRLTDVSFLSRERVRTTFLEDFRELVTKSAPPQSKVMFEYAHPHHDTERRYAVDAWLNGSLPRQVLIFAIGNDDQCRDATIKLYRWEQWDEPFHPVGIFRDQTEINRNVLARFSDVAERQFSSLDTAHERLPKYLSEIF